MRNAYKYLIVLLGTILFSNQLSAQQAFPDTWEGKYSGELQIYGVDSVRMSLKMHLDILKKSDSIYQWKMVYDFQGKKDVRDYELVVIDKAAGKYAIDEKNSIVIDSYYKSGYFTSFFEVMDSFIISSYTKKTDSLIFEIIAASGKNAVKSGNKKVAGEKIPEVTTFLVNGRQKAVLKKMINDVPR